MEKIFCLKDIQKIELDILNEIANICDNNNLRYFLAGGTLLGAIRHKGFIPWDNDIDISMPRPDYDKFISIFNAQSNKRYRVLQFGEEYPYAYSFAKVVDNATMIKEEGNLDEIDQFGVFVDVFPIDGFKGNYQEACKMYRYVSKWCNAIVYSFYPGKAMEGNRVKYGFLKYLTLMIGKRRFFNYFVNKLRKNNFDNVLYVASTFGAKKDKEVMDSKFFSKYLTADFEGRQYRIPIGYNEYLTRMYGDYMKLPPENERIIPHDFAVFLK